MKKAIRVIVIVLSVWWGFSILIAFFKANVQDGEFCEDLIDVHGGGQHVIIEVGIVHGGHWPLNG